jgi:predicted alpha/beta-hydrolase family hydrolase
MASARETREWCVAVGAEQTSAIYQPATVNPKAVFVCAHGAGGHKADRGMERLAAVLCGNGFDLVRFNFLYREAGSRRPDPMARLTQCFEAVVTHARAQLGKQRLLVGGRSMGGRAASMMAAEGFPCDGLLLFAYPLHPPGKPGQLRVAHLPKIRAPVLCINGTRDAFCTRELMERALETVTAPWTMHWLQGADHSFRVLKSSGRSDAEVYAEIAEASSAWLAGLTASASSRP